MSEKKFNSGVFVEGKGFTEVNFGDFLLKALTASMRRGHRRKDLAESIMRTNRMATLADIQSMLPGVQFVWDDPENKKVRVCVDQAVWEGRKQELLDMLDLHLPVGVKYELSPVIEAGEAPSLLLGDGNREQK